MGLVNRVIGEPALVEALRGLAPDVFSQLVSAVGLESAGDLVALATMDQLETAFDEDLWRRRDDDPEDAFDAERLGLWLRILFEAGEDAVVARLLAFPPDLLTLAVHRVVLVVDIDALGVDLSEDPEALEQTEKALESRAYEEWEEYRLIARDASSFEVVWDALLALDREHHDQVRRLLDRCAALSAEVIDDGGGLYEVLTSDEMLEADVRGDRDDRRATRGYVSTADARSFLELSRAGIGDAGVRDPVTRAYFRELSRESASAVAEGDAASDGETSAAAELAGLLRSSGVVETPAFAGLLAASVAAPGCEGASGRELLATALRRLHDEGSAHHAERLDELGYLVNVVVSGMSTQERRVRPVDALELVTELVGVGLRRALGQAATTDLEAAARRLEEISADRLFREGYRALHAQAGDPTLARAAQLLAELSGGAP
jgi:hypothetical protein